MNLEQALTAIAAQLNLDAAQLIAYAAEDTIGGFSFDETARKWDVGSLWEVEGKVLYALTRALAPAQIAEFGTHQGCSATHFLEALKRNGYGQLYAVDPWEGAGSRIPDKGRVDLITHTGIEWLDNEQDATFDILFEDMVHGVVATREWWLIAQRKIRPGGLIISHDAAHFGVGVDVMRGIEEAGVQPAVYLIEPSDCGLAIWQAPGVIAQPESELPYFVNGVGWVKDKPTEEAIADRDEDTLFEIRHPDDLDDAVHAPVATEEMPTYDEMTEKPKRKRTRKSMKAAGE
jgi:predicted O-methyltransferase YrrM